MRGMTVVTAALQRRRLPGFVPAEAGDDADGVPDIVGATGAEEVEERLFRILDMVNDWLKFAETKNAGLVGLSSTGVSIIAIYLVEVEDLGTFSVAGMLAGAILLIASLVVAFTSFIPQSDLARVLTGDPGRPRPGDNLYYYGHLARYRPAELAAAVGRRYAGIATYDPTRYPSHTDLAAQITINARIATSKYELFTMSAWLFFGGVLVAITTLLINVFV